MNRIIALKLITGEDIIGEEYVDASATTIYPIKNPIAIVVRPPTQRGEQPAVGFGNFPMFASVQDEKEDRIRYISPEHIILAYEPSAELEAGYKKIFGAGIILPDEKKVILG